MEASVIKDFMRSTRVESRLRILAAQFAGRSLPENESQEPLQAHLNYTYQQSAFSENFIQVKRKIETGFRILLQRLEQIRETKFELYLDAKRTTLRLIAFLMRVPIHFEQYERQLKNLKNLKNICHVPDNVEDLFYSFAKEEYCKEHYEISSHFFSLLTLINASQAKYWMGFGNSEYCLHHYDIALTAYSISSAMNPFQPSTYLFSRRCADIASKLEAVFEEAHCRHIVLGESLTPSMRKLARVAYRYLLRSSSGA